MKPSSRKSFFRRLLGQQRGSVTPLFLLSFTAILGTTLGGVDLVRYNVVQSRLQSALDGATLSAGRNLQNRQTTAMNDTESTEYLSWQDDAFGYFRSNMPENYLGNTIEADDLTISYSDTPLEQDGYTTGQFVSMRVEGTLPLVSTGFLQVSSMKVVAENRAVRHTPADIELVMALDNTGSMSDNASSCRRNCTSKIQALRDAATDLSTVLFTARDDVADGEAPRDITIGLVPFADTVNVGNTEYTRSWLSKDWLYTGFKNAPESRYVQEYFLKHNWLGCIAEPLPADWGPAAKLPAKAWTPGAEVFMPLHLRYSFELKSDDDLDMYYNRRRIGNSNNPRTYEITKDVILDSTSSNPQPRRYWGPSDPEYDGSTTNSTKARDRRVNARPADHNTTFTIDSAANPSNCVTSRKALFLSDDQGIVEDAIDGMNAEGSTLIPAGLLWAWRMLNPTWNGAWDGSDKPQSTNTKALRKVIVLLTDGENAPSNRGTSGANNESRSAFQLDYDVKRVTTRQTCTVNGNRERCSDETDPTTVSNSEQQKTYRSDNYSASTGSQSPMNSLRMRDPSNQSDTNPSIGWGDDNQVTRTTVDNYLTALCEEVKNDGNAIKIYTVTLGELDGDTETMMNECSSGAGYYYNTRNSDDLPKVFQSIAAAMVELRLTK